MSKLRIGKVYVHKTLPITEKVIAIDYKHNILTLRNEKSRQYRTYKLKEFVSLINIEWFELTKGEKTC